MEPEHNRTVQEQNANSTDKFPFTFNHTETDERYIVATQYVRNIFIPIISSIGFFGNTLTLIVFSMRRMRNTPSSVFLVALALVDNAFVIGEVITWVDGNWADILTEELPCQCVTYVAYVSSFLSVWFIVGFTCERFCAICFPLKKHMCSVYRQRVVVVILTPIACVMYHFSFWTVTVQMYETRQVCVIDYKYIHFLETATWIDSAITMIIPFTTIALLNAIVLRKALSSLNDPRKHANTNASTRNLRQQTNVHRRSNVRGSKSKDRSRFRITRTLLLVSTAFLVLNLPSHIMRLYNLAMATRTDGESYTISVYFRVIQEFALMLYYTTFTCNFFIYTFFVRDFRNTLKTIWSCHSTIYTKRRRTV